MFNNQKPLAVGAALTADTPDLNVIFNRLHDVNTNLQNLATRLNLKMNLLYPDNSDTTEVTKEDNSPIIEQFFQLIAQLNLNCDKLLKVENKLNRFI